jgi:hypothetical protein
MRAALKNELAGQSHRFRNTKSLFNLGRKWVSTKKAWPAVFAMHMINPQNPGAKMNATEKNKYENLKTQIKKILGDIKEIDNKFNDIVNSEFLEQHLLN